MGIHVEVEDVANEESSKFCSTKLPRLTNHPHKLLVYATHESGNANGHINSNITGIAQARPVGIR